MEKSEPSSAAVTAAEGSHHHHCINCYYGWECNTARCELPELSLCLACHRKLGSGQY